MASPIVASQSGYNNVNQLTNRSGAGPVPVHFLGTVNEYATVMVTNQAAALLDTNFTFAATVNLPLGTNLVPVVAMDVNGNKATNNYAVTVAGDLDKVYRYDLNGNCTNASMTGTNTTYEWDAENRLHAINTYVTNTATLQRSEFSYDGFDRWVQIIEKTNGVIASTKRFVWCGGSRPDEERDGSNVTQKRFFAEGEEIGGTNYYFVRDRLGNVQQMVDSDGYIRADYRYDPYGNPTKVQGDMDADFQFAGYYKHAPSGLYLTMFRAYDPDRGWLNRDPIEELGGLNLYDYVGNDPMNSTDPTGQNSEGTADFPIGYNIGGSNYVYTPLGPTSSGGTGASGNLPPATAPTPNGTTMKNYTLTLPRPNPNPSPNSPCPTNSPPPPPPPPFKLLSAS